MLKLKTGATNNLAFRLEIATQIVNDPEVFCSPNKNSIPFCAIYFTWNGKNSNVSAKLLYTIGAKVCNMAYVNQYSVKKEVNYWRKNMQTQKYLWSIVIHTSEKYLNLTRWTFVIASEYWGFFCYTPKHSKFTQSVPQYSTSSHYKADIFE